MKKVFQNRKFAHVWRQIRPWAVMVGLFLVLRFTGGISALSYATNSALMATGIMNAKPVPPPSEKSFNYDFTLRDASGNIVNAKEFKNKTIFLNIWATWCGPCRYEMPSIHKLYNDVDHNKIVFIMLSVDAPDSDNKVKNYIKENNFTFPVYRPNGSLPLQLDVNSIPTTFIISPEGKIVSKQVGAASYDSDEFKKFIEGL